MNESVISVELSEQQVRQVLWHAINRHGALPDSRADELSDAALRAAACQALIRASSDGPVSHTLVRGLLVLSAFKPGGPARGVSEVAEELDMKISTVHRLLRTLEALSLLQRDDTARKYRRPGRVFQKQA
jgi:DNA-binding MarR family transcriptional regulator